MLILVAVAVNTAVNSGLFGHAQNATGQWAESQRSESEIGNDNYVDDTVGKYTPVDMKKTLENFTKNPDDYKHPDQSNTNGDRAIGTDGKSVNMDLWKYEIIDEDNRYLRLGGGTITYGGSPSYANENIIDGKIQGTVPQYVHIDGKDGIFTVTDMFFAFVRCSNLVIAPEIPNTVTNMLGTFSNCKSLEKAPEIPETVMSMRYTFMYCTSLTEIQDLPNSVSNMEETFKGCENLTKIGKLPENITSLDDTFFGCTSLKTAPTLPKKLESLRRNLWWVHKLKRSTRNT